MHSLLPTAIHSLVGLLAAGILAGCASTQPQQQITTRNVEGAMVADDQQLYIFTIGETLRVDAAPFQRYRALMDSPVKDALACSLMVFQQDRREQGSKAQVHGSYGMLLHAAQVTPQQAQALGLVRVEVSAKEAAQAQERAGGWGSQPPTTRYQLSMDPACGLPLTGGSYYSVVFESTGQWVKLPNQKALLAQSRWPKPLVARSVVLLPPSKTSDLEMGMDIGGALLGVAALPVVLPAMLLVIPFLGPDHWK